MQQNLEIKIKKSPKSIRTEVKKTILTAEKQAHHLKPELVESAVRAGLHYVTEESLKWTRVKRGRKFFYLNEKGQTIKNASVIKRINGLAIPPAYKELKISADPNAHLQAVGRDARRRRQYRYHPLWKVSRDANKYHRILDFAKKLPLIRKTCEKHLRQKGLSREKVLATVVELLEKTLIRVGNEEYAKSNHSFGLTTLRNQHVVVDHSTVHFSFLGKSKVYRTLDLHDQRLANIIKNCQEIPGHDLFQYVDENGQRHNVSSEDVNNYLKETAGEEFSAKDFRTWGGSVLAAIALKEVKNYSNLSEAKRNINKAIESVAQKLGNTKSICRKCYVHPEILNAYMDKEFLEIALQRSRHAMSPKNLHKLKPEESAVLALLDRRLKKMAH